MSLLSKQELIEALKHLGQLAQARGESIQLLLLGGGVMVLAFDARQSTRDVDAVILSPNAVLVRELASLVAKERGWSTDWLNDAAKGFIVGDSNGPVIFSSPGLEARRPSFEQLLAMKLCAWRDDVDVADARRLLRELKGTQDEVWQSISPFLQPGRELKARYAFDDLWEELHGTN
jgi:nucleotidyltransferase DUF2204